MLTLAAPPVLIFALHESSYPRELLNTLIAPNFVLLADADHAVDVDDVLFTVPVLIWVVLWNYVPIRGALI